MHPSRKEVTSTKNPLVKRFREAAQGRPAGVVMAEGVRLLTEALDAGLQVLSAAVSPRLTDDALRSRLSESAEEFVECTDQVLERLSMLTTPQGVAAILGRPSYASEALLRGDLSPLLVVASGIRDPGNLGALVRTAEAAGATGFLALAGGADPFRDKALRGSSGSVFRLPTVGGLSSEDALELARRHRLQLVVADGNGRQDYEKVDYRRPTALVLGAETGAIPDALRAAADHCVRIDMAQPVESLNVAVAAGILLFEVRRQRK